MDSNSGNHFRTRGPRDIGYFGNRSALNPGAGSGPGTTETKLGALLFGGKFTGIAAAKLARAKAQKKHEQDLAAVRQANIEPARKPLDEKAMAARKAAEEKKLLAEKKRRYEKVMEQIRLEQKLIDEQQARVAGEAAAAVDDEI